MEGRVLPPEAERETAEEDLLTAPSTRSAGRWDPAALAARLMLWRSFVVEQHQRRVAAVDAIAELTVDVSTQPALRPIAKARGCLRPLRRCVLRASAIPSRAAHRVPLLL